MVHHIRQLKNLLSKDSSFVGGLSVLVSSAVASQLVLLVSSIAVGRLFSPSEVGEYAVVISLATILTVAVVSTYQKAVPLAETDAEARALTWVSILIASAQGVILVAALGVAHLVSDTDLGIGSGLLIIAIIAGTILSIWSGLRAYLLRIGLVSRVGTATVTGNATQGVTQVIAGLAGLGAAGLSFGYVIGRVSSSIRMLRKAKLGRPPSWRTLRKSEARWRWQSGMLLIPAVLTLITVNATAPLMALMFGTEFAGFWSFAMQFSAVPLALLGQSVTNLSLPETAKRIRDGQPVQQLTWRLLVALLLGGMPAFASLAIFGPELFMLILGSQWREAGVIAAILAPWLALNIGGGVMSQLAIVQGRYRFIVVFSIIDAITRIGSLLVGWWLGSGLTAVALYSLSGFVTSLVWIVWGAKAVAVDLRRRRQLLFGILALVVVVATVAACRLLLPEAAYYLVGAAVVGTLGVISLRWYWRNLRSHLGPKAPSS